MEVTQKPQWLCTSLQKAQKDACSDTSKNYVLPRIHHLGLVDLEEFIREFLMFEASNKLFCPFYYHSFILTWTRTWSFNSIPFKYWSLAPKSFKTCMTWCDMMWHCLELRMVYLSNSGTFKVKLLTVYFRDPLKSYSSKTAVVEVIQELSVV